MHLCFSTFWLEYCNARKFSNGLGDFIAEWFQIRFYLWTKSRPLDRIVRCWSARCIFNLHTQGIIQLQNCPCKMFPGFHNYFRRQLSASWLKFAYNSWPAQMCVQQHPRVAARSQSHLRAFWNAFGFVVFVILIFNIRFANCVTHQKTENYSRHRNGFWLFFKSASERGTKKCKWKMKETIQ